jgi:2-polyprenyl-6-methoxyphenol hydroxylase-like FAD-dependent oxidoreductase
VVVRSVLVVGAGIAGSTCAYLLGRAGFGVTVVEQAGAQRSSGSPVDVRGTALKVVEEMGVLAAIRSAATHATRLAAVDGQGREIGWIPTQVRTAAVEIRRGDLADILASAASQHAMFVYQETITSMDTDSNGVDVSFRRSPPRRFHLVVGSDGLHSTVRRLVFGPEERFTRHLGLYFATVDLGQPSADPRTVLIHNRPGAAVVVHPTTGREGAGFLFRHRVLGPPEQPDLRAAKTLVAATYRGMGWRVPELLDHFQQSDDIYIDAVSRVALDQWSSGRIVLLGDSASCVTLFGEGSSMAIAGAATLADALVNHATDPAAALTQYERAQRKRVQPHQRGATLAGRLLVPRTRAGIAARNQAFRAYSTAANLWSPSAPRAV